MSTNSLKKLGLHEPNLAYDLPETLIRIRKLMRNAELEGLPTFINHAQLLLDHIKIDIESHLLLLQNELTTIRDGIANDNPESGGLQHPQSTEGW